MEGSFVAHDIILSVGQGDLLPSSSKIVSWTVNVVALRSPMNAAPLRVQDDAKTYGGSSTSLGSTA